MNLVVAVSGGVDSVVLLDLIVKKIITPQNSHLQERTLKHLKHEAIVAHVDHGIRDDSAADARFVEALAAQYGLAFVSRRFELGAGAGEDAARQARYGFLRELAAQHEALIVTAHHQDDIIGSIAINLHRGTGWRGLAVINTRGVIRPLLGWTKLSIYDYALRHRLEWVEDSTNRSDRYLRNQLRGPIQQRTTAVTRQRLALLRRRQLQLTTAVDHELAQFASSYSGNRHFYTMVDITTATELLRHEIAASAGKRPTAAQAERAVLAIRSARADTWHDVGDGVQVRFSRSRFVVEVSL